MARGRLLRTKVKEARAVSKATESARLKAGQDAEKKKPLEVSLREHLGKIIDRVDPVEFAAVIGVTLLLAASADFLEKVKANKYEAIGPLAVFVPMATVGPLFEAGKGLMGIKGKVDSIEEWFVIFCIAYLIVHNFGLLVQTTGNIAKSFSLLGLALLG